MNYEVFHFGWWEQAPSWPCVSSRDCSNTFGQFFFFLGLGQFPHRHALRKAPSWIVEKDLFADPQFHFSVHRSPLQYSVLQTPVALASLASQLHFFNSGRPSNSCWVSPSYVASRDLSIGSKLGQCKVHCPQCLMSHMS